MKTDLAILRLRRANPVPRVVADDHDADLFARITALPRDASLAAPHWRPFLRRRAVVLVVAAVLAVLLTSTAFAVSRLTDAGYLNRSPIGIFRQVERPTYDDQARAQVATASEAVQGSPEERLTALINAGDTWTIQ